MIVVFQAEPVRTTLIKAAADTVAHATGWSIHFEKIDGLLPLEVRAKNVAINYCNQPVCDIEHIEFMISPFDLLHGSLVFSLFKLSGCHTYQEIKFPSENSSAPFLRQITVKRLELSGLNIYDQPDILKKLTIRGDLSLSPFSSSFSSNLTFDHPNAEPIEAAIFGEMDQCNFHIHCRLQEALLNGSFVYDRSHRILCRSLEGAYLGYNVALEGEVALDIHSNRLSGQLKIHSPIPDLSGTLDFAGLMTEPTVTLTGDQFQVQTNCQIKDSEKEIDWEVTAHIKNVPIQLNFRSCVAEVIEISDLVAILPHGSISGYGTYNQGLACHLEGDLREIEQLATPFNFMVKGATSFVCDVNSEKMLWTVLGSDIVWKDWAIEKLSFQKQMNNESHSDYILSAHRVSWKETTWDELSVGTSITPNWKTWPFSITATGKNQVEINASGQWHLDSDEVFVHVGRLNGTIFSHPYELDKPVNCFLTDKTFRTSQVEMHVEEGAILFEGKFDKEEINCLLDLKYLPVDLINHLLPQALGIHGDASLFLRLMGPPSEIQGSMVLQGKNLQVYDESLAKLPLSHGKVEAVLTDDHLTFEGQLINSDNPFYIKGVIPFVFSLNPIEWTLPAQQPIRAHLTTSGEISPYLKLFVTDTTNVEGHIDIDVDFGGTVERPIVEGKAYLTDGLFESLNTGLVIKDIECLLIGNDKKLILDHLTGNDGAQGTFTAQGLFELDKEEDYPLELSVGLNNAIIVRLDYADMATSGTVTLTGNRTRGRVTGDVKVDRVNMQIPEQIPVQMKTVDVIFINDPDEEMLARPKSSKKPWPIDLELNFTVPENFFGG